MSGGIGAALSTLVPPDRHFGFFLAVEKEMPLRRAERKVRLVDLFCVKKVGIEQRRKSGKGKIFTPSVSKLTAPSEKEPDSALSVSLRSTALFLSLSVLRTALPEGEPRKKHLPRPLGEVENP